MTFAEKLKEIMVTQGVTQGELARMSGIGKSSISMYLSGRVTPSDDRKRELAEALKVPPERLDVTAPVKKLPKIETLSVTDAARILGKTHTTITLGLRQGVFPWGYAIQTSPNRWSYLINRKKFCEIEGVQI